jgi:hypothetical protein
MDRCGFQAPTVTLTLVSHPSAWSISLMLKGSLPFHEDQDRTMLSTGITTPQHAHRETTTVNIKGLRIRRNA